MQSCRLEKDSAKLLIQQAKRRLLDPSTLASLYLTEKTREQEYPGIGFRDHIGGREAYILGHRVAVWQVVDVYKEAGTVKRTADHFNWPDHRVKCALAYADAFPAEVNAQREAEVGE